MFVDVLKSKAMILVYMFALNLVFFSIAAATAGEKILYYGIIGTNQETETWRVAGVNLQEMGVALEQVQ